MTQEQKEKIRDLKLEIKQYSRVLRHIRRDLRYLQTQVESSTAMAIIGSRIKMISDVLDKEVGK